MRKSCIFLSSLFFLLFSCQNFLDSGDLKDQINEAIAEANADTYTITILPEKAEYGQCSVGSIPCKVGKSFDLFFTLSSGYIFKNWECNDSEAVVFEDTSSLRTTVTLKKGKNNLVITAKCQEKFIVKSVTPAFLAGGVERDSPIVITFSRAVNTASVSGKIDIISETGEDVSSHYGDYVWSTDNSVLKIPALRDNPVLQTGFKDIVITIRGGVYDTGIGNEKVSLGEDFVYTFRLNPNSDNTPPSFVQFKIAKKAEKLGLADSLKADVIPLTGYEETETFHVGEKLYLYCLASDEGSGAYYFKINDTVTAALGSFQLTDAEKKLLRDRCR